MDENVKKSISDWLRSTERENIDSLIAFMDDEGFSIARVPAVIIWRIRAD